jgi:hypothetical protein
MREKERRGRNERKGKKGEEDWKSRGNLEWWEER